MGCGSSKKSNKELAVAGGERGSSEENERFYAHLYGGQGPCADEQQHGAGVVANLTAGPVQRSTIEESSSAANESVDASFNIKEEVEASRRSMVGNLLSTNLSSSSDVVDATEVSMVLDRIKSSRGVDSLYDFSRSRVLGKGMSGSVITAHQRATGEEVAVKSMPYDSEEEVQALRAEMAAMRRLDHPNIVKLLEVFDDAANLELTLILELCKGGSVAERMKKENRVEGFSECETTDWTRPLNESHYTSISSSGSHTRSHGGYVVVTLGVTRPRVESSGPPTARISHTLPQSPTISHSGGGPNLGEDPFGGLALPLTRRGPPRHQARQHRLRIEREGVRALSTEGLAPFPFCATSIIVHHTDSINSAPSCSGHTRQNHRYESDHSHGNDQRDNVVTVAYPHTIYGNNGQQSDLGRRTEDDRLRPLATPQFQRHENAHPLRHAQVHGARGSRRAQQRLHLGLRHLVIGGYDVHAAYGRVPFLQHGPGRDETARSAGRSVVQV